jgi:hypothetical protein
MSLSEAEQELVVVEEEEEEAGVFEEELAMAEALRSALHPDYADASPEEVQDALYGIFDSLSPAESFNLAKALRQIEQGAAKVFSDPAVGQIARAALPIAGGAVGTLIGGPAGTALGSTLGTAAARAFSVGGTAGPPSPPVPTAAPVSPVVGGSAAAAQGLVLTQQPDVLRSLLALALGQQGRQTVSGVPVGAVMNMLSSVFGRAAADADELVYVTEASTRDSGEADGETDVAVPGDRARTLYAELVDAENLALDEAMGLS